MRTRCAISVRRVDPLVFVGYCLFRYPEPRGSVVLMNSLARFGLYIESALIVGVLAAATGCGSEPVGTGSQPMPPPTTPPTTTTPPPVMPPPVMPPPTDPPPMPPPPTGDWETLLTGDWTMAPGTEGYVCVRK